MPDDKNKQWTKSCGICRRKQFPDYEFSFSEEDLLVNKIGVPYVRCPRNHCINLSKNEADGSLREAINRKLASPDTVEMLKNVREERKVEKEKNKEIKRERKEIERRKIKEEKEAGEVKVEDMLINAGIGNGKEYEESQMDEQLEDYLDDEEEEEIEEEEEYKNKEIREKLKDIEKWGLGEEEEEEEGEHMGREDEERAENFEEEESSEDSLEKGSDFPEKFLGKVWEILCPMCHEYFTFSIADIRVKKNGVPMVLCLNSEKHSLGRPAPVTITKEMMGDDALLKEAVEYVQALPENVEKIKEGKGSSKKKEKARRVGGKDKGKGKVKREVPEETDEVILKHEYMYEKGDMPVSVEMKERETVKMWGDTALNELKRERLKVELGEITAQEDIINRILKRFDENDAVRNNQIALFDTIKEFIPRLQSAYATDVVNAVFSVDKRYRPLVDSPRGHGYGGYDNMDAGAPPMDDYGYYQGQGYQRYGNEYRRDREFARNSHHYEPITWRDVSYIVKDAISESAQVKEKEKYTTPEDVAHIVRETFEEFNKKKEMEKYVTPEDVANIVKSAFTDRVAEEDKRRREEERAREIWGLRNEISAVKSEIHSGVSTHKGEESSYLDFLKGRLENLEKMRDENLTKALENMQEKKIRSENFDLEMKKLDHETELKKMELNEEEKKRTVMENAIAPVAAEVGAALGGVVPNLLMPKETATPSAATPPNTNSSVFTSEYSESPEHHTPASPQTLEDKQGQKPAKNHSNPGGETKTDKDEGEGEKKAGTKGETGSEMERAFCPSCGNLIGFPKGVSAFRCPVCGTINEIRKCKECGAPIIYMRGAANVQCSSCGKVYRIKKVGKGKI